jgi:hypothetical protein
VREDERLSLGTGVCFVPFKLYNFCESWTHVCPKCGEEISAAADLAEISGALVARGGKRAQDHDPEPVALAEPRRSDALNRVRRNSVGSNGAILVAPLSFRFLLYFLPILLCGERGRLLICETAIFDGRNSNDAAEGPGKTCLRRKTADEGNLREGNPSLDEQFLCLVNTTGEPLIVVRAA